MDLNLGIWSYSFDGAGDCIWGPEHAKPGPDLELDPSLMAEFLNPHLLMDTLIKFILSLGL